MVQDKPQNHKLITAVVIIMPFSFLIPNWVFLSTQCSMIISGVRDFANVTAKLIFKHSQSEELKQRFTYYRFITYFNINSAIIITSPYINMSVNQIEYIPCLE